MRAFDLQVDFFLPVWRRVAVVIVCALWSIFEFFMDSAPWGVLFGGVGIYAIWQFFLDGWPESHAARQPDQSVAKHKSLDAE